MPEQVSTGKNRLIRRSLREQVRDELVAMIMSGQLESGQRLNESNLAKELGVSLTPVREALLGLEGQGFITSKLARGFFVNELSVEEVRQRYLVIMQLEVYGLSLVEHEHCADQFLDRLRRSNRQLEKMQWRPKRAVELDVQWHGQLLSMCPNQYLVDLVKRERHCGFRYEYTYMVHVGDCLRSVAQHDAIIDLLARQKFADAQDALRNNWSCAIEDMVKWLQQTRDQRTGESSAATKEES